MPRLVDHAERRSAIIETTWQVIADRGIENASMRDIARECGYAAPGDLAHYFPNKDALLLASYQLICQRTNERIASSTEGKRGITALRSLCLEIIPAEDLTTVEAKVAVSFWQRAQSDQDPAQGGTRCPVPLACGDHVLPRAGTGRQRRKRARRIRTRLPMNCSTS